MGGKNSLKKFDHPHLFLFECLICASSSLSPTTLPSCALFFSSSFVCTPCFFTPPLVQLLNIDNTCREHGAHVGRVLVTSGDAEHLPLWGDVWGTAMFLSSALQKDSYRPSFSDWGWVLFPGCQSQMCLWSLCLFLEPFIVAKEWNWYNKYIVRTNTALCSIQNM